MFTHTGRAETFSDRADYQHQGNSHHTHQESGNTRSFDRTATPFRPLSLWRCQMHAISRLPSLLPSRPLLPPNPHPNPPLSTLAPSPFTHKRSQDILPLIFMASPSSTHTVPDTSCPAKNTPWVLSKTMSKRFSLPILLQSNDVCGGYGSPVSRGKCRKTIHPLAATFHHSMTRESW